MGTCLSKKKPSSTSSPPKSLSTPPPTQPKNPENNNNVTETTLNNKPNTEPPKEDESQPKKEIFIIKHRKSHDEREKNSKITPFTVQHNVPSQQNEGLVSSSETESTSMNNNINNKVVNVVGVRTSSCTKEEVDAILIQCGRLSRSSSGKAASSSANGRKYSGSKRSFDFDNCDNNNDAISAEDEQKRTNVSETSEEHDGGRNRNSHRQRNRGSPKPGRRRTPSREREQQRSSSRERRVSRSPGRRSSDNNNGGSVSVSVSVSGSGCSRPGKMVTVPATVTSLVMDKSNNGGGGGGGGESVKRGGVKRNVGLASPRSMSPARGNGNQQQPCSLSRNNSSRKAEVSPYKRNPLSEVDPNSLAYPQSNANVNGGNKVQNKSKKEVEVVQKPNVDTRDSMRNRTSSRGTLEKGVNHHQTKEQQEEEIKLVTSDNAIVKNMVMPSGIENFKPQTLTRSRSSRRSSRDFDINPEPLTNLPPQQNSSYTSLLLEDIQNFHQKTHPSVSLPPCLNKACSILEAVADLNSTTSSNNFSSGAFLEDKKTSSIRNEYNVEEPFVESEVVIFDDVMEPSLHKYVTVKRGGSLCEDQESSGSNSFTVSSGQKQYGICSSSWEQNSCDSSDCWSSRLNSKDESLRSPLGLDGSLGFSCEANKKTLNGKRRECDHQHSGGIGRGRLAADASALT